MEKLSSRKQKALDARRNRQRRALRRAIEALGTLAALTYQINVLTGRNLAYQSIQGWVDRGELPPYGPRAVEIVTFGAVQCEELDEDYALHYDRPYRRVA